MPDDQKGSSSYERGDAGGACGDYNAEHGVSEAWLKKRVTSGMKKASPRRALQAANKMISTYNTKTAHLSAKRGRKRFVAADIAEKAYKKRAKKR